MTEQRILFNRLSYFILLITIVLFTQCQPEKTTDQAVDTISETLLDKYVYSPNPSFHYEIVYQGKKEGYTFYVLKMIE